MDGKVNALNWFEISVSDINRAKKFYETIFGIDMGEIADYGQGKMAMFPSEEGSGKVSGALCEDNWHKPSMEGSIIYLNGNPDLQNVLSKVEAAGGKVTLPKRDIGQGWGFMAYFIDTEGNVMALHSNK